MESMGLGRNSASQDVRAVGCHGIFTMQSVEATVSDVTRDGVGTSIRVSPEGVVNSLHDSDKPESTLGLALLRIEDPFLPLVGRTYYQKDENDKHEENCNRH